ALKEAYVPIKGDLEAMEALLSREMVSDEPFLREFLDHFAKYRGKRVRPALLFLFGRALGEVSESHVRVAASAELIHVATLIHDDILDEASVRRQIKTPNSLWGNERAVLLGDWVFAKAFEITAKVTDFHVFGRMITTSRQVCQGEMLQICHRHDLGVDEDRYLHLIRMKTGSLFAFCVEMGAYLSGASPEQLGPIREYGENIGVAFQIIDDCLDIMGKEEVVGKSLGTDVAKGKVTLPIIRAFQTLSGGDRTLLEEAFRGADGKAEVRARVEASDAVSYAKARAGDFTQQAKGNLAAIDGSPLRRRMEELADFVIQRKW
ncbi:MAG: polyprenyl synthetase family protein, partial [Planctomycetota bacterium]